MKDPYAPVPPGTMGTLDFIDDPHIHMMVWADQKTMLKRESVVKLRSAMTNSIFRAELENLYIKKDIAYQDVTEAAREVMREIIAPIDAIKAPPQSL